MQLCLGLCADLSRESGAGRVLDFGPVLESRGTPAWGTEQAQLSTSSGFSGLLYPIPEASLITPRHAGVGGERVLGVSPLTESRSFVSHFRVIIELPVVRPF